MYPWVIIWLRGLSTWTTVDQWVLMHCPKILEPLSQTLGPMLSISGSRPFSPVTAFAVGVAIAVLTFTKLSLEARNKRRSPDGRQP